VPTPPLAELFRVAPLPRWRAIFAIVCAGAAFLCAGGMLEYGTGSPETKGTPVSTYWALLFGLHVLAFGGAGLLAAFPPLASRPIKLAWALLTAAVFGLTYAEWNAHQATAGADLSEWLSRWPAYITALATLLIGLCLPPRSSVPDE
jgi:hypothetical protein